MFSVWEDPDELLTQPTRERMLDVSVQLREPTKVSVIAEKAQCDTETARDYLDWFASMGIVREHRGRPTRYERNESYLWWRRVEAIRTEYSEPEIVEQLEDAQQEIEEYRERFGVDAPGEVSLVEAGEETSVGEAWEALSAWKTAEKRAALLDAARRNAAYLYSCRPFSSWMYV